MPSIEACSEKDNLPSPPSVVIEAIPPLPLSTPTSLASCPTVIQRRYVQHSSIEYPLNISSTRLDVDIDSLTLMEQIVLLGLNDKQGYVSFLNDSISYVLRGCIIIELALRGRIQTVASHRSQCHPSNRHLEVISASSGNTQTTGDPILDEALRLISLESHSINAWIDLLSGESWNPLKIHFQIKQLRERISKGLVDKGILGTNKKTIFLFLEMATHPLVCESKKIELLVSLRNELLGASDYPSNLAIGILGASALAARVIHGIFSSLEYSQKRTAVEKASKWLRELSQEDYSRSDIIAGVISVFHRMDSLLVSKQVNLNSCRKIPWAKVMLSIDTNKIDGKTNAKYLCTCSVIFYDEIPVIDMNQLWPYSDWILIGEGRSSRVYQVSTDKAIKIHEKGPECCKTFCKEAAILWRCRECPWIVELIGVGKIYDHTHCILLELMKDGPIYRQQGQAEDKLIDIAFVVLKGLEFLNDKLDISHGDISPNNILMSKDVIKLADLEGLQENTGVLRFRAPELFLNGQILKPHVQDIWSLGMVLVYLVSGKHVFGKKAIFDQVDHPFEDDNIYNESELDVIYSIITDPVILSVKNEMLSMFIMQCLEKNQMKRPTAKELLAHPLFNKFKI